MLSKQYRKLLKRLVLSNPKHRNEFTAFLTEYYIPRKLQGIQIRVITYLDEAENQHPEDKAVVIEMQNRTKPTAPIMHFAEYAGGNYLGIAEAL